MRLGEGVFTEEDRRSWLGREIHQHASRNREGNLPGQCPHCMCEEKNMIKYNINKDKANGQLIALIVAECNCAAARK